MAQSFALSSSPELLRRARSTAPFWFSLLLSLWLVIDTAHDPLLGATGLIPLLPAMVMIGLTVTLLVLRANDASACLLAVYMCTLAVLARGNTAGIAPPWNLSSGHPALYEGGYHPIHIIWALALGGVPLYFGWIYTEQDRVERRTWLKHLLPLGLLLCSALGTLACLFIAMHRRYTPMPLDTITRTLPSPYHRILLFTAPMVLTQHAAAFWLLLRHHRQWGEPRHRALVLVFGFALLFVSCVIINDSVAHIATWVLANLTACLVPLMVVYSLEKHALFDIRIFLRRTVQYALARQALTLLSLAPLIVLAYLWGLTANGQPEGWDLLRRMTMRNETLVFGALSLVFATTLILRAPLLRHFDRAYFREIYDAQRMLNEVGRSLLGISDPREIGRATLEGIDAALHPINAMLLAEENGHVSCLAHRNYAGYRPPLWPDPALLSTDRVYSVPSSERLFPLRRLSWADALPSPARALLTEARIRLVIPVRAEDRTIGVLLLGEKASGMAYAPEDIEVLRALASQIALAMQSARLNREFLRRSTYELKAGSVGFVELVERERRLLAADLHDQTLPELRCLLTDLQSVADSDADFAWPTATLSERSGAVPVRMTPEEMAEHLRQTIENIRDIMESLRPSALEVLGLMPALENELRKAASRARPPLVPQFQVMAGTQPDDLNSFAEMSIFRIVQEAVNNACRHSGAQTVRVQIDVEDSEWVLRIEDDGVGQAAPLAACMETADGEEESNRERPPAEVARRGRGLDNMQYRASLIGARLAWDVPDWGKGTRVELRLPLKT